MQPLTAVEQHDTGAQQDAAAHAVVQAAVVAQQDVSQVLAHGAGAQAGAHAVLQDDTVWHAAG